MNERTQLIIRLISTHIVLIPVLIFTSLIVNRDSFLLPAITQTALLIIYLSGYWEFPGLRIRWSYCLSIEFLLLIVLFRKIFSQAGETNCYLIIALSLLQAYLLIRLIRIIIVIFRRDKDSFEIVFPFRQGKYMVTDGGNSRISRLMNYHFFSPVHKKNKTNLSMLFATDIVKINNFKSNFLPLQNEDYPVFGEKVNSPTSGLVVKVINNIEDNIPYAGNYPYNTGNTVVIQKDNRYMLIGHLKMNSVKVRMGDKVNAGDMIAEAGNSGYSERPHIHMQLIESATDNYWKGVGVSIQFRKKNLYKNRVIDV